MICVNSTKDQNECREQRQKIEGPFLVCLEITGMR